MQKSIVLLYTGKENSRNEIKNRSSLVVQCLKDQALSCTGSSHCFGAGSISGPGTSACDGHGQNKQTNKELVLVFKDQVICILLHYCFLKAEEEFPSLLIPLHRERRGHCWILLLLLYAHL